MPDPTAAAQRESRAYLVYGNVWDPLIDDTQSESAIIEGAPVIGSPLFLMWTNEGRTINGTPYSFATPQLTTISQSSGGVTGTRWVRVLNRPATGTINEPIRQTGDVTDDDVASFEVHGWSEALAGAGGFGGSRVSLVVHDPQNLYSGIFVQGRSVSIYVEEWEDGSLKAAGELFSGFVDPGEREDQTFKPVYTFTASTIERLMGRTGLDGRAAIFVDEVFMTGQQTVGMLEPIDSVSNGMITTHQMSDLNVAKVVAHLMQWHMAVDVGGTRYRLIEVCDLRVDWWNLGSAADYTLPMLSLPEGNVMQAIAGLMDPVFVGYSFRTSDFTVTPDHEFKSTQDSVIDAIDPNFAYEIRLVTGPPHPIGQVQALVMPSLQDQLEEAIIGKYPASRDSQGSIMRLQNVLASTQVGANRVCQGAYNRGNAEQDKLIVHLPGATFGLHNLGTYGGNTWSAERADHSMDDAWLGPHESLVTFRKRG